MKTVTDAMDVSSKLSTKDILYAAAWIIGEYGQIDFHLSGFFFTLINPCVLTLKYSIQSIFLQSSFKLFSKTWNPLLPDAESILSKYREYIQVFLSSEDLEVRERVIEQIYLLLGFAYFKHS
jgi:hypothetical protein